MEIIIKRVKSNDFRSYHINSDKFKKKLGFKSKYNIEDGVKSLMAQFKKNFSFFQENKNKSFFYNVKHLKKFGF